MQSAFQNYFARKGGEKSDRCNKMVKNQIMFSIKKNAEYISKLLCSEVAS